MTKIDLIKGDITKMDCDAIVTAANNQLLIGNGADEAIHKAAGPELFQECKKIGGCADGEPKITGGYRLKARHVIHVTGPIYSGESKDKPKLEEAYNSALKLALDYEIKTIAFPSISTGVYKYPKEEAATIAIAVVNSFLKKHQDAFDELYYVMHNDENYEIYKRLLGLN